MIKSMTGYGRAEAEQDGYRVLVEIKAVNHRYAEVVVRMPRDYLLFEDAMKKVVLERVSRGRLDVFLTVERIGGSGRTVVLDEELAVQVKAAADSLAARLGLGDTMKLPDLMRYPGVVTVVEEADDPARLEALLLGCTRAAVDSLLSMRQREGERLTAEFTARLGKMRTIVEEIAARSPLVVADYRERLHRRLQEALESAVQIEEARLLTEVALFVDRASIDEELVRLASHFEQFAATLDVEEPVGRKLDFLIQEMNREVNTIGSKANDLRISAQVVEAKSVLEQIREQIQNVE
ncbi:MAG: YicC/YloC family endoribonuclease [Tumebacillaceae bacterium]